MEYSSLILGLMGASALFLGLTCLGVWKIAGALASAPAPAPVSAPLPATGAAPAAPRETVSPEVVAAISAALAEELGTEITGIRIHSIRRV